MQRLTTLKELHASINRDNRERPDTDREYTIGQHHPRTIRCGRKEWLHAGALQQQQAGIGSRSQIRYNDVKQHENGRTGIGVGSPPPIL